MKKTMMKNALTVLLIMVLFCCLVLSSGCATVMTGKYQSIPVTSEPPGAKVRADTGETIITPGKFNLIRNEGHTLLAELQGYEPQQLKLHNKAQGWVWGNVLLGGVIGLIVDCVSGASDERNYKRYDLKDVCDKYDEEQCKYANVKNYNEGSRQRCVDEAKKLQTEYETWINEYWHNHRWSYTPCNEYQRVIFGKFSEFTKSFEFFFVAQGYNIGSEDDTRGGAIHWNFVGIFHRCNRSKALRGDKYYPNDMSDATLDPYHEGVPPYVFNSFYGNPYVQRGRISEQAWF